jgi:hypothetical protein
VSGVNTIQRAKVNICTLPVVEANYWNPVLPVELPGEEGTWTWGGYLPQGHSFAPAELLAYWTWGGSITWGGCAPR